jgi:AcrR family transcriptional regulator
MTGSEKPRPTKRGRETLEAIDAAARKVIAKKGFLKMRVADILAEAGRSPASFYNYYDSKEALLENWARQFQVDARVRAQANRKLVGREPRQRVEASARAHWETYRERLAEMVGVFQLAMVNDDFARVWDELCEEAISGITEEVVRAQERGYCPGVDPRLTATAIVGMLNMFSYDKLANGGAAGVDDEACIATLTEIWFRAVYWRE